MRLLLLSFLALTAQGCSNGATKIRPQPLPEPSKVKNEMGVPQQFFANANWAFNKPDCYSNETHLRIHFDRNGFRSVAYPESVTMTEFHALNVRVFPNAPDGIEIDVKSETGGPSTDTIEFRLLDNGERLQWKQFREPTKIILFRCFAASD